MSKIKDAKKILKELGLPPEQQNEMSALTLLALTNTAPKDLWKNAARKSLTVTKGIMDFAATIYHKKYAPNTRETFRRHVLHQFVQAGIADYNPDNPQLPTNHPRAHYAVSQAALTAIRTFGTKEWLVACEEFKKQYGSLLELYLNKRKIVMVPVRLSNGEMLLMSPGKHNQIQAKIIEEFAPRFAGNSKLIYLGDTSKKHLVIDESALEKMKIPITEHDKLPDIVLYDDKRKWLFLIEAVTSHGPMSPKRVTELKKMFSGCSAGIVFVTAFLEFAQFRKYSKDIAWETEVWIAENPDHLIHYNGNKFLGPH